MSAGCLAWWARPSGRDGHAMWQPAFETQVVGFVRGRIMVETWEYGGSSVVVHRNQNRGAATSLTGPLRLVAPVGWKLMPPCTELIRAHDLKNCLKAGMLAG
jgi:hypothetical protein